MPKTRIYFVRHCEAEGNFYRLFHGHYDSKITQNGKIQLGYLAERFKDISYDYIYSSPINRTMRTAKAVNKYRNLDIIPYEGLIEINGGHWENVSWKKIPELYPDEAYCWAMEPHKFAPLNGETMLQVRNRIINTTLTIANMHPGKTIVCVSHGCVIRNMLCWAKGWDIDKLNDVKWSDNTAISLIEIDENNKPTLLIESDNSHLPENNSTLGKQSWWKPGLTLEQKFQ